MNLGVVRLSLYCSLQYWKSSLWWSPRPSSGEGHRIPEGSPPLLGRILIVRGKEERRAALVGQLEDVRRGDPFVCLQVSLVEETDAPAKHGEGVGSNGVLACLVRVQDSVFQDKPASLPLQTTLLLPQVAGDLASLRVGRQLESLGNEAGHVASREFTSFEPKSQVDVLTVNSLYCVIASVTDTGGLKLSIAQRSLAGTALSADNLSATSTVVSPTHQRELGAARLAHCNSLVGNPDWSGIAHLSLEPQDGVEVVEGDKGCFPAPVLFYGTVQGVQPTVPLFHIPGLQRTAPDVACDAELVLKILSGGNMDVELIERDGVGHFETR